MKHIFLLFVFLAIGEALALQGQQKGNNLRFPRKLQQEMGLVLKYDDTPFSEKMCRTCERTVDNLIKFRKSNPDDGLLIDYIAGICSDFGMQDSKSCRATATKIAPTIGYILDNGKSVTPVRSCSIAFQNRGCVDPNADKWLVDIPPRLQINTTYSEAKNSDLRILHLTDVHIDQWYQPGGSAACIQPLCCQKSSTPDEAQHDDSKAGFWGDYHKCDMPFHSLEELMNEIRNHHNNFDFIYFTGDIDGHRKWDVTLEQNEFNIKQTLELLAETFKNKTVYPVLGNNEPYIQSLYSPKNVSESVSMQVTLDLATQQWARWLPSEALKTVQDGGYYTVLVRSGFRIIGLNTNVCLTLNWWLIYDDNDPYGQLKWLVNVLTKAEIDSERVHILGHVPIGTSRCHRQWLTNLIRIIRRFSHIIAGQFYGHTHSDELRVVYDLEDPETVANVAYIGGSFTTFVGNNPNFRIYDISGTTLQVLDYDEFAYNLTAANGNHMIPNWYKLYSFKEAYGLKDLSFTSIGSLMKRMSEDTFLMEKYFRYSVRNSDLELQKGCNTTCLRKLYCEITALEVDDVLKCG